MIAIIDYGVGNLFSLRSSLTAVGAEAEVVSEPALLSTADKIILPGVGAFGDAMQKLTDTGMAGAVLEEAGKGKPLLGICLGMQLLFERSLEFGVHPGLGLLRGEVRPISEVIDPSLKIPHIGWNGLHLLTPNPLFRDIKEGDAVYFVHSFHATGCEDSLTAVTEYSAPLAAAVMKGSVFGCQFHPEKSGAVGLSILRAFAETEADT
jgi:glutamine amidotransferase